MSVGRYLFRGRPMKEARELAGLTQDFMAKKLGITIRQYCRWEYGEVELKPYQLSAINNLFGINPDD